MLRGKSIIGIDVPPSSITVDTQLNQAHYPNFQQEDPPGCPSTNCIHKLHHRMDFGVRI